MKDIKARKWERSFTRLGVAILTLVFTSAVEAAWVYDSGLKTLTDGNWTFNTTGGQAALTLTSVKTTPAFASGCDLAAVEADTGCIVVSLGTTRLFESKTVLTSVTLPSTLTSVPIGLFSRCTNLGGVDLSALTISAIPDYLLELCSSASNNLVLPETITSIGSGAFKGCVKLTGELMIPATVTTIGANAFYDCKALKAIRFAEGSDLTTLGAAAFNTCWAATNLVVLPAGLTTLAPGSTFERCSALAGVDISQTQITAIPNYFMSGCTSASNTLVIPDTVASIGKNAFYNCNRLAGGIIIPAAVKTIDASAFNLCNSITSVFIHDGCTSIGDWGFSKCTSLTNLYLPRTLNWVGKSQFENFPAGAKIWWQSCPETIGTTLFYGGNNYRMTNYVAADQWADYDAANAAFTLPADSQSFGTWTSTTTQYTKLWSPPGDPRRTTILTVR